MFSKIISDIKVKNQLYRDNLYRELHSYFQKALPAHQKNKITKSDFNIFYKNRILEFLKEKSNTDYESVAKSSFPFEILFHKTAIVDAVVKFSLEYAFHQFNAIHNSSLAPEKFPFTLVARGGYGRCEMFPMSDIDLVLVSNHQEQSDKTAKEIIRNFEYLFVHQNIFPSASSFGYLTLNKIALPVARKDINSFRSLLEGRFIAGNKEFFSLFQEKIFSILESNKQFFIEDNRVYSESYTIENTVFQQEPNVKKDIRRFYWALFLAKMKFGFKENSMVEILNKLFSERQINEQIYIRDQIALNFLFKVRLLLHLIKPSGNKDSLSFENRETIAQTLGFELNDFYKEYFYQAALPLKIDGRNIFWHCLSYDQKVETTINSDFGVNSHHTLVFLSDKEKIFSEDPEKIFNLMRLISQKDYGMSYPVILAIEQNINNLVPLFMNGKTKGKMIQTFQEMLLGKYFARAIRNMHEFGLISNFIIPEFSRLCGLPQDIYVHRFPVDIHIMAALDALNELGLEQGDPFLVNSFQILKNKKLLIIAILLHDIGKGFMIDFKNKNENEIGESLTPSILKAIGIVDKKDIETICFLVGKHLAMKDLLDLDPSDDETYELIWKLIDGDMEKLRMLILLTFADRYGSKMKMSSSQISILKFIYQRTMHYEKKESVDESLKLEFINLINLPPYLQTQLNTYNAYKQSKNRFAVEIYYVEDRPADLILCLDDQPEILYRIACIIAFNKVNVIDAQVNTWKNTAMDIFRLTDAIGNPIDYSNFFYIQKCLKKDIEKIFVEGYSVVDLYKNKSLLESNTKRKYKEISLKIRIIGRAVKIVTPDFLGVFMQTTKTLASMNISIDRAILHCRNGYANNVFYLQHKDINKLNNMEVFSKKLKEELNKLVVPGDIF